MTLAPVTPPTPPYRNNLWTFATGDWHYLPDNPLPSITGRSVTFRLGPGAVSEASFTIDANLREIANIGPGISDLWIAYNRKVLFRGRIGPFQDSNDGTTHTVTFQASDYRAMLGKRIIWDTDTKTWTNTDESQVAWNLIAQSQGRVGGGLGITRGSGQTTGVHISPLYDAGATVQDTIDTQAATDVGFDWDITPQTGSTNLTFDLWHPARGTDRGVVLIYPGRVQQFSSSTDLSTFANAIRATGTDPASRDVADGVTTNASHTVTSATANFTDEDINGDISGTGIPDNTTITARASSTSVTISNAATATATGVSLTIQPHVAPQILVESTITTDPAGRWEGQFSDSDVKTNELLVSRGNAALTTDQQITPVWTVVLNPDSWAGPSDIWLGDPVTLVIQSGYRRIGPETLAVHEIQVSLDDNSDAATVQLTLGAPPPGLKWNYRAIDRRLRKLERR